MADRYEGLFLRHYAGQRPDGTGTISDGWTDSPDILLEGLFPVPDPSIFATRANYDQRPTKYDQIPDTKNYVYIRGLNTTSGPIDARLWLYYTPSNMILWPQDWRSDNIIVDDPANPRNWVQMNGIGPGEIGVGAPVFQWRPIGLPAGQHFCMIAFAENPPLSNPPRSPLPDGYMGSWNELGAFVQAHPNMAWRNTRPVSQAGPTWQRTSLLTGAREGGEFRVGYSCKDMPTDGYLAFSVPGYDRGSSIVFPNPPRQRAEIYDPNQSFMVKIRWRDAYSSSLTITYWQGSERPVRGATITPIIAIPADRLEGLVANPRERAVKLRVHEHAGSDAAYEDEHVQIIGSMPYEW